MRLHRWLENAQHHDESLCVLVHYSPECGDTAKHRVNVQVFYPLLFTSIMLSMMMETGEAEPERSMTVQ